MPNLDDPFNCPSAPAKVRPSLQDVIDHLKFGTPREVQTKVGPRIVRDAKPPPELLEIWDGHAKELAAQDGLTPRQGVLARKIAHKYRRQLGAYG